MIPPHRLPVESFDALCAGSADKVGLSVVNAGQLTKHLMLIRMVVDLLPPDVRAGPSVSAILALLDRVREWNRPAFDHAVSYPYVASGLVHHVRRLRAGGDPGAAAVYLAGVAITTAVAAELDFELDRVPVTGPVHLPGLGVCRSDASAGEARIARRDGRLTVAGTVLPNDLGVTSLGWTPVRHLDSSADGRGPVFDDVDPDRSSGDLPAEPRLSDLRFEEWQRVFTDATRRLDGRHQRRADQIRMVLRALTPLRSERPGQGRSASAWQAYGAVAVTLPRDPVGFGATLIHETQHSILNGLLDLFDFFDPDDSSLHYSPWRADPRPLRGVLHGAYAFVGVADFWARERADGNIGERAEFEFIRTCRQVRQALDTLDRAAAMTDDGQHLVAQMAGELARLEGSPPTARLRHLADLATEDHRVSWRLRIAIPDPTTVDDAVRAWRAGARCPSLPAGQTLAESTDTFVPNERIRRLTRLASGDELPEGDPLATVDDRLADREYGAAVGGYSDAVAARSDDLAAWTGLALAAARQDRPGAWIWLSHPELVRNVYRRLSPSPDPLALAAWLADGLPSR